MGNVITPPSESSIQNPKLLSRLVRQIVDEINAVSAIVKQQTGKNLTISAGVIQQIRQSLQLNGSNPLNVQGLLGVLAQPQVAGLLIVTTLPAAQNYEAGTMAVVTGNPSTFYFRSNTNPPVWTAISTAPSDMMTTDTAQNVTATKTFTVNQAMQGIFSTYNNLATVDYGLAAVLGISQNLALAANLGNTTVLTAPATPAKLYLVAVYLCTNTVGTAGSTVTLTVAWNDGNAVKNKTYGVDLTINTQTQFDDFPIRLAANQIIQISTSGTYNGGAKYDLTVGGIAL